MPRKTFETLNGLRGVAALIVVMWHGEMWFGNFVPASGYLAVDLFFVLSGFVIAHSYRSRLASNMTVRQFSLIRMIRLYPLYLLGTVTSIALVAGYGAMHGEASNLIKVGARMLPFALLMLPAPAWLSGDAKGDLYPLNVPAWSLFCELVVNFVYAVTWRIWSPRTIIIVIACAAALMLLCEPWFAVPQGWGAGGFNWQSLPFGLLRVFYSFPAGVLIYQIVYERDLALPRIPPLVLIAIAALLLVWHTNWSSPLTIFIGFPVLVAFACRSEPTGIIRRICDLLGNASYAIYALHYALIGLTVAVETKFNIDLYKHFTGWLFLAALFPIALAADRWFDGPVRKFLNLRFQRTLSCNPTPTNRSSALSSSICTAPNIPIKSDIASK